MKKMIISCALLLALALTACGKDAVSTTPDDDNANAGATTGMGNPWVECDKGAISNEYYLYMDIPEDATDVIFQKNDMIHMAEAQYNHEGIKYNYRVAYTMNLEDISGMYCEWDVDEPATLMARIDEFYEDYEGNEARFMGAHTEEGDVQVILWFDPVFGRSLCLTAQASDLDGFDIQAVAEQLYFQPDPDTLLVEEFPGE